MTFTLHRQCNFAADRGCAFGHKGEPGSHKNPDHTDSEMPDEPHDKPQDESQSQDQPQDEPLRLPGLEIGPLYDCDEGDDAECDLCGRPGGILQFFDVDPLRSSLPPPGEEGWLAHVPCK